MSQVAGNCEADFKAWGPGRTRLCEEGPAGWPHWACVLMACGTILARPCQSPGCFRSGAMSCQLLTQRDKQTGRKTNRLWSGLIRLLLRIKTRFRVEPPPWVGPQTFVSLPFSPTSRERHLSGPSLPSHVLCKAGPMRDGRLSASAHTAMGWGTHPWGPKICDRDEGGRTQGTPRSTRRREQVLLAVGRGHSSSSP